MIDHNNDICTCECVNSILELTIDLKVFNLFVNFA